MSRCRAEAPRQGNPTQLCPSPAASHMQDAPLFLQSSNRHFHHIPLTTTCRYSVFRTSGSELCPPPAARHVCAGCARFMRSGHRYRVPLMATRGYCTPPFALLHVHRQQAVIVAHLPCPLAYIAVRLVTTLGILV
nr:hypothetical protein CFP56_19249 [Quercus suber]